MVTSPHRIAYIAFGIVLAGLALLAARIQVHADWESSPAERFAAQSEAGAAVLTPLTGIPEEVATSAIAEIVIHGRSVDDWDRLALLLVLAGGLLFLSAGQRIEPLTETLTVAEGAFPLGVLLAVSFLLAGMNLTSPLERFLAIELHVVLYIAAAWLVAANVSRDSPLGVLAFHRVSGRTLRGSIGAGMLLAMGAVLVLAYLPQGESHMIEVLKPVSGRIGVIGLALVSPWAEELLIRGALYGGLQARAGALVAILGSAAIFILLHVGQHWGSLGPLIPLTAVGLTLSLIRWRSGSTLAACVCHLTYNLTLTLPALL
jgi:membrane protease YdiL (CAAX protease family)